MSAGRDVGRVYRGFREPEGEVTVLVGTRQLPPRLDLRNHSPSGFEWGYWGSGPAQLALAILADYLGDDDEAQRLYQRFKQDFVGRWGRSEGWTLTGLQIEEWCRLQPAEVAP